MRSVPIAIPIAAGLALAAMAQEPILSPTEKTNLRNARFEASLPMPPARETFRTALPVVSEHVTTQLVVVAVIQTVTVRECMCVRFYRSNVWHVAHFPVSEPEVRSITTNRYENAAQAPAR